MIPIISLTSRARARHLSTLSGRVLQVVQVLLLTSDGPREAEVADLHGAVLCRHSLRALPKNLKRSGCNGTLSTSIHL